MKLSGLLFIDSGLWSWARLLLLGSLPSPHRRQPRTWAKAGLLGPATPQISDLFEVARAMMGVGSGNSLLLGLGKAILVCSKVADRSLDGAG